MKTYFQGCWDQENCSVTNNLTLNSGGCVTSACEGK